MNRILVIGATGNIGREVVAQLPATGAEVRALVRNPDTAGLSANVHAIRGDLTVPETLDPCLDGVDAVFLVWTAPPATAAAVLERIVKQARRIVFLSSPYKTPHPFFQASQPNAVSRLHAEIEGLIEASGREWTFLRPGMLASNALGSWGPQIRSGDVVRWPYIGSQTAPIDERDIAAVAVRALSGDGHAGAEYVLTGPESISQSKQITTIGDAIGRSLRVQEMSPDDARNELGFPLPLINMLLKAWAAGVGQPAYVTATVGEITGSPARTYREWATDHAAAFRG